MSERIPGFQDAQEVRLKLYSKLALSYTHFRSIHSNKPNFP